MPSNTFSPTANFIRKILSLQGSTQNLRVLQLLNQMSIPNTKSPGLTSAFNLSRCTKIRKGMSKNYEVWSPSYSFTLYYTYHILNGHHKATVCYCLIFIISKYIMFLNKFGFDQTAMLLTKWPDCSMVTITSVQLTTVKWETRTPIGITKKHAVIKASHFCQEQMLLL